MRVVRVSSPEVREVMETTQHALDAQAALVALSRSLVAESVNVQGGDGRIYLTGPKRADIDDGFAYIVEAYKTVTSRKVCIMRLSSTNSRIWCIDSGEYRRGFYVVLTDDEKDELYAGSWYGKQA